MRCTRLRIRKHESRDQPFTQYRCYLFVLIFQFVKVTVENLAHSLRISCQVLIDNCLDTRERGGAANRVARMGRSHATRRMQVHHIRATRHRRQGQ